MSLTPKLALATAGGGSAITGGIIYSQISGKTSISELIKQEGKTILLSGTSEKGDWDAAWKTYKTSNNPWMLDVTGEEATQAFKDTCKSRSEVPVKDSSDKRFQEIKSWCTRNLTVSEWLQKEGIQILKKGDSADKWNKAWGSYKDASVNKKEGSQPADNDVWGTEDWSTQKNQNTPSDKFKEKCEEKAKVKVADTSSEDFQRVKAWCWSK
ncbi:hypothetical protein HF1_06170 [Mycoplasma haemofelis str. Langford 1]|uniref:Uncharacterized protein n=1 Tax=Mycoplasma haemofelis (strain Langford 1) TaxID=941640 RepID=E8ZHK4_MYCHL|nr:hypothetical protein [Mycoplasma haemofelis]CBY92625.1 hypothetical protein HF1_06170 [Mycoplasma haemofelis str. Langford 1]